MHRTLLFLSLFGAASVVAAIPPEALAAARAALRANDVPAAETAARALVAAHPAEATAHALLASALVSKGDPDGAVASGEKAAELAPADSNVQRQLGDTYGFAAQKAGMLGKLSNARKARSAYERAVELDPKNIESRTSLMNFFQMAPSAMGGGLDKAREQAVAIAQIDPKRGHLATATIYSAEKKYTEALAELDAILRTSPDDYAALYQVGKLSATSGQSTARGLAALRLCLELPVPEVPGTPSHAAAQWRIGNILEKGGKTGEARQAYQAAVKLDPKFAPAAESLKKLNGS